jgi:hypothetical protein
MNHLYYPRHFALLACFSVLIAAMSGLHLERNTSLSLAIYGVLHASALVFALRSRSPIWRKCSFIAIAAFLSVFALRVGIDVSQLAGIGPGSVNVYGLLALSAAAGALTYGLAIRVIGIDTLTLPALAAVTAGCLLATSIAGLTVRHFHLPGAWLLAVVWWHAFSAGLSYFDRR